MQRKDILATFKLNVIILASMVVLFSVLNCFVFWSSINNILKTLDNSFVMYKGFREDNVDVCYPLKATRKVVPQLQRSQLDSLQQTLTIQTKKK